ncbi:hypothetical protein E3U44_10930 [Nitrosococcus wardiae]|uniref:DUF5666 domain-containing protein n=2 Tax=Nitrosococcus wardiae TaxID=1814290 RepID=A0A4P7C438_9GAMM|nr:hypothetical protein E3U44_10930 [Nitrosococcus wardiae]
MFKKQPGLGTILFLMLFISGADGANSDRGEEFIERYEKFIPFDYSPGLESKKVAIGNIVAIDREAKMVTIRIDSETHRYKVMEDTPIWLDQPQRKTRNLKGSLSDLEVGLRAEIQTDPGEDKEVAKWIKVQINE